MPPKSLPSTLRYQKSAFHKFHQTLKKQLVANSFNPDENALSSPPHHPSVIFPSTLLQEDEPSETSHNEETLSSVNSPTRSESADIALK